MLLNKLLESEEQIYLLETQENELKTLNTLKKSLRKVLNKQNENNIQQTLQELAELYTFYNAKDARLHAASLQWTARFLVERTANDAVKEKAANTAHFVALLFQNFPGVILFFLKEVYRFAPQLIPFRLTEDSIPVFEKISFQGININEKVPPKEKDEFRIFINKISAVTSLFCALLAYDCYEPLDTSLCWFWLSAVCNKKLDKTFAYLLQVFLEFAGKKLCEKYKKQFQKILYYIKVNLINEEECRKIQLEDGVVRILHKLINDLNVSAKPVGYY
ncbi:uncharacterized protein LOC135122060 [Zophobas morio]|uniref:uncharacterized protein LOC135122060 n=1 Tax=Zophobas morio TaxID=2755281 RepID=UPI003082FC26